MKRSNLLMTTALLSVLFFGAGCSDNDTPEVNTSKGELNIIANIDRAGSNSSLRSIVTATSFSNGENIGVFIAGDSYTSTATEYTYSGTSWGLASGYSAINLSKTSATVFGYYPSTLTPDMVNKTAPVNVSYSDFSLASASTQDDYMYATNGTAGTQATVSKASSTAALTYFHVLSQITLEVAKDATYGGTGSLTNITFTAATDNITGSGVMSLSDGAVTLDASPSTAIALNGTATLTETAVEIATVMVAPFSTAQDVTLSMTIDGESYSGTITNAVWTAGTHYTYKATIGGSSMSIDNTVSITPWTDATTDPAEIPIN